ncbi:glycosyltransferase [Azospirillum sp. TSH58]|uniref:glycosyltransferase n=1 Tax=Azospirillum sp. TSH58 TaxID=664962 RepID=UPI000D61012E|nr:glycosyltransferase [Azospirillum sp. TSH58]PWC60481.1 hypothetical protein TSH58_28545 [Azospirillum sp. TSH58]
MPRRFLVVTPCLNAGRFIDETILSVLGQAGDFEIHYHVQDGRSQDGTVLRLAAWSERTQGRGLPPLCRGLRFSFNSAHDTGLYDAVARGFSALPVRDGDVLTWLNASDRLLPGAFQTVADLLDRFPETQWIGGRVARLNERGNLVFIEDVFAYPTKTLIAGLHDNRHLPFVQQEGCFWTGRLWRLAGGMDCRFQRAGDFDLWRRFAMHAPLTVVNSVLATFRQHTGQLGSDIASYHAEIDRSLTKEATALRATVWDEYRSLSSPKDLGGLARCGYVGPVLQYVETKHEWVCLSRFPFALR